MHGHYCMQYVYYHWEKGLVSVLMKLSKKFKVSSNGPSTEWIGYDSYELTKL
jgi:hypothetical protein